MCAKYIRSIGCFMENFTLQEFQTSILPIVEFVKKAKLDSDLERKLNDTFPSDGDVFKKIEAACHAGLEQGHLCKHSAGGILFGRAIKPTDALYGFSVDVVKMENIKGPHHIHPEGEIDMIMPISKDAMFDGKGAGWMVYEPNSSHSPTVSKGDALVLYLLPDGQIKFT